MGQVTTLPTLVLANALMPKARSNNLILLKLKGGMFNNIQTEAVLGTCHTADKFFGLVTLDDTPSSFNKIRN
jgi:hypothetical protein